MVLKNFFALGDDSKFVIREDGKGNNDGLR